MDADGVEIHRVAVAWIELDQLPVGVESGVRESCSWGMDVIDGLTLAAGALAWRVINAIRL